ncbi:cutinase family protein [soil metagenome]
MLGGTGAVPTASADSCPDIEVVFARGTGSPPGLGVLGDTFVDSLRSQVGGRSVSAYGVNYPASLDFEQSVNIGASDASAHVENTVATCPNTKIVLGGYSQGADVIALITAEGAPAWGVPTPMPPGVADHVASVVVFGNPAAKMGGGPLTATSSLYGSKSIDVCIPGDPICSNGFDLGAHGSYVSSGKVEQAANYVAGRI